MNSRHCALLGACFALLHAPLVAQDNAAPTGPVTTIPSDSNSKTVYTQLCQNRLNKMKGRPVDLMFIGDSITQNWDREGKAVWARYYAGRNAFDFGVGADTTQNVLWRLENMDIRGFQPKAVVLLIGTNNFGNTPQDVAAGVKADIAKIQEIYPGVKIVLCSIMPNGRNNKTMMAADDLIKDYGDNQNVFYVDLCPAMPQEGSNWKGLGPDRLHPNASGYEIWAEAIEPTLSQLLGPLPNAPTAHP